MDKQQVIRGAIDQLQQGLEMQKESVRHNRAIKGNLESQGWSLSGFNKFVAAQEQAQRETEKLISECERLLSEES